MSARTGIRDVNNITFAIKLDTTPRFGAARRAEVRANGIPEGKAPDVATLFRVIGRRAPAQAICVCSSRLGFATNPAV
jgi:hypothetical protein